jgi:hypothetical protein
LDWGEQLKLLLVFSRGLLRCIANQRDNGDALARLQLWTVNAYACCARHVFRNDSQALDASPLLGTLIGSNTCEYRKKGGNMSTLAMSSECLEVSLDTIRTAWRTTSAANPNSSGEPVDTKVELETYLNATTFSVLLKMDSLAAELHSAAMPKGGSARLDQIEAIKRQIVLCSDIGLFSIRGARAR